MLLSLIFSLFLGFPPSQLIQSACLECTVESAEVPNVWEAWIQDESRMSWWKSNGWLALDEVKANTPVWTGVEPTNDPVDPLACGMKPHMEKSLQWAFSNGTGIHLHGLDRCEMLYQRFLINEAAESKKRNQ